MKSHRRFIDICSLFGSTVCLLDGSQITVNIPTCLPLNMLYIKHVYVSGIYRNYFTWVTGRTQIKLCSPWNTTSKRQTDRQTSCHFISTSHDTRRVCAIKIPQWCFVQIVVYHFLKLQFLSKWEWNIKKLQKIACFCYPKVFKIAAKYTWNRVRWVYSCNVTMYVHN